MSNVIVNRALVVFADEPDGSKRREVVLHWMAPNAHFAQGQWWMRIEGHGKAWRASRDTLLDSLCATLNVSAEERHVIGMNMVAIEQQEGI